MYLYIGGVFLCAFTRAVKHKKNVKINYLRLKNILKRLEKAGERAYNKITAGGKDGRRAAGGVEHDL